MEAGKRTARHRNKEQREEIAALVRKSAEVGNHGGGHLRLAGGPEHKDAHHGARDHDKHHDRGEVVARLLERLDGHRSSKEQIDRNDGKPAELVEVHRELHAHGEHRHKEHDGKHELLPALKAKAAVDPAKGDGHKGEENRDSARRAAGIRGHGVNRARGVKGCLERSGDHVHKGRDHDDGEEPAKEEEESTPGATDVLLDKLSERLAVVAHGCVERAKVVHGAKEDAAHENPQQHRQPAEHHGSDGSRDGAGAADGAELVREGREARGGREVLAVLHAASGREGLLVNPPGAREPAAVEQVPYDQHRGRNKHDNDSVHVSPFCKALEHRTCCALNI